MSHRRRPRIAPSVAAAGLVLAAGATALLAACNGTTTVEDAPPITGVRVDSASLFGASGCGTDDARIAKFAATLSSRPYQADGAPLTPIYVRGSVFDCIGDGTFLGVRLTAHYQIRVFGYSQAAFAANPNVTNAAASIASDGGMLTDDERDTALRQGASVIATCDADQYEDIVSTATCVVELDTRPKPSPADAGGDAGETDASTGDAGDASDAGDVSDDASTDAAADAGETDASTDAGAD